MDDYNAPCILNKLSKNTYILENLKTQKLYDLVYQDDSAQLNIAGRNSENSQLFIRKEYTLVLNN